MHVFVVTRIDPADTKVTVRLMIASTKYLIAKINSMLIPGNAKRIIRTQ